MRDDELTKQSLDFAVTIISLVKILKEKHESIISAQIGRSGTSIGANIREAQYAHSKSDFAAKLQIALKEASETEYWLELMQKAELITMDAASPLLRDCGSLRRMMISSINTAKQNMNQNC